MASSGSFNTSGYNERYLTFSWSIQEQSISGNYTTISWSLVGAGGSSGKWYNSGNYKVVIDGSIEYQSTSKITLYAGTTVASGTKTIYHNGDGNKSLSVSVSAGIYAYTSNNASGSGSWDLTQIPRQATITSAPNFDDEENPTISYSNPAGNAVESLQACIATPDGQTVIVSYRNISKTGSSYTFSLSEYERNSLRNYCKNSNSTTVRFYVATNMAGSTYYSALNKTLTIINASPTMNPTATDTNSTTAALTGNSNNFIRYRSTASVSCNALAHKGASITSCKITNGGSTINSASGTFSEVDSGKFIFTATDSRGNTVSKTINRTCYAYVRPTVSITEARLTAEGELVFKITGSMFSGSFGASSNANWGYYKYKVQGGTFTEWVSLSANITPDTYNTYTATGTIHGLDYGKTYIIVAAIEDSFSFRSTGEKTVVSTPVYDWGEKDFRFYVPTVSGPIRSLGGVIPENFIYSGDLNNYTIPDVYCIPQNDNVVNVSNTPPGETSAGKLIVESALGQDEIGGKWSYVTQRYIPYAPSHFTWVRGAETGSAPGQWNFSDWVPVLNGASTDYIIAQGSSGIWNYRKWNSGRAECWGTISNSGAISESWGSGYCGMYNKKANYPFYFLRPPVEVATVHAGCGGVLYQEGTNSASSCGTYGIFRAAPYGSQVSISIDIYAIGNWK